MLSGRITYSRQFYCKEYQAVCVEESVDYWSILWDKKGEDSKGNYYASLLTINIAYIGTGLGGRHKYSSKLKTISYLEAIDSDSKEE